MPKFAQLATDLMVQRLAPPTGPIRLLIDSDAANEIDDQFAIAWALLSPAKLQVQEVTAEPFSFAYHLPELHAAESAILAAQQYSGHLAGGLQGWLARLHAKGQRVKDLNLVGPARGMALSFEEILRFR